MELELNVFEQLEKKVEKVIELCAELKEENKKLAEETILKNDEVKEISYKLEKLDQEKQIVKEKVETLIERLDGLIQNT